MFAILYQMRKGTIAGRNDETKIRKIKERHEGTKARRHEGTKHEGTKARRHEGTKERRNDQANEQAVNKRRKE